MVVGECPETDILCAFGTQAIECKVMKEAADTLSLDARHYIESPNIAPAKRHGPDSLTGIDGEIHPDTGVG
jgi:hypothetical protein